MKTSNKLLLITSIIIISALIFYNYKLKAEYDKREYKSRFYKMTKNNIDGFTSIENNASNLNISIEKGDKFEIWYGDEIQRKIVFNEKNDVLSIDFQKTFNEDDYFRTDSVIIICPKIENVKINNLRYKIRNNKDYYMPIGTTSIHGFNLDKLNLVASSFTYITLDKNVINKLSATIGGLKSTIGTLTITKDNQINNFSSQLKGNSVLNLDATITNKPSFVLSDNATVNLSGRALKLLKY